MGQTAMRGWEVAEEIQEDPEKAAIVKASRPLVEKAVAPLASEVTARWSLERMAGGYKLLKLNLADEVCADGVSVVFEPKDLCPEDRLRRRLRRLWRDLLQERSHELVRRMQEGVEQLQESVAE
jgi:hypothetical protein